MNRILAIHRGSLGDFLLLVPTIAGIKHKFPEAHIEGLGHPEILSLICPGIMDAAAAVESAAYMPLFEGGGQLRPEIENHLSTFDAVIAFVSDPEHALEHNLRQIGVKDILIHPPFPPADRKAHVGEYFLETVAAYFGKIEVSEPLLQFSEDEIRQAKVFLGAPDSKTGQILAIHPGSGGRKKCWPVDRFEAVLRRVKNEAGCCVLLILGPADEHLAERMMRFPEDCGCFIAHNLPLRRLAAILSECGAYLGNDSGITHLAATTGIPTLAIFGPTDPDIWAPKGNHVKIIKGSADCSPCLRETMRDCGEHICLDGISVEEVVNATLSMLAQ